MIKTKILSSDPSAIRLAPVQTKSPQRILVVDDEIDSRQLTLDILTASGYEVEGVKDGDAGWEALQTYDYDLIITDNNMPKMKGLEMIEKLRAASMTLPVIMATGLPPTHEFVRRPWLKPDITLAKPFTNDDLLAAVKKLLGATGRDRNRPEPPHPLFW